MTLIDAYLRTGLALWVLVSLLWLIILLRVSGVTLLEKQLTRSKPGYAAYLRATQTFFPWFPKASPTPADEYR